MVIGRHRGTTDVRVERAVTVGRPPEEMYAVWRHLENLSRFMAGVEGVRGVGENRYRWTTVTSDGRRMDWEAEILEDVPGRSLSWASVPGADVSAWGSVRFHPAPGGRGTEVMLDLRFEPPASATLTEWFWNLFGADPGVEVQQSLRRFQQLMETGEVAKSP